MQVTASGGQSREQATGSASVVWIVLDDLTSSNSFQHFSQGDGLCLHFLTSVVSDAYGPCNCLCPYPYKHYVYVHVVDSLPLHYSPPSYLSILAYRVNDRHVGGCKERAPWLCIFQH